MMTSHGRMTSHGESGCGHDVTLGGWSVSMILFKK